MDNNIEKITLRDEEGKEINFEVITKLDIEEKEYVIVVPEGEEEELDAIALRIDKGEHGEDILVTVEDDNEFAMVSEAYSILFDE